MIRDTILLAGELIALFFGVTFAIQLLQRRVGVDRLQAWLGGTAVASALKGIAIGFVTPFCTFSAIPLLMGFRQAHVRTAGYVAFIVAAPVLDPVLAGALILIAGPVAATLYVLIAFAAAMVLALIADRVGIDRHLRSMPMTPHAAVPPSRHGSMTPAAAGAAGRGDAVPSDVTAATAGQPPPACAASSCDPTRATVAWRGYPAESRSAAVAAVRLLRSVAVVMFVGIAVGIAIERNLSPTTAATLTGDNTLLAIPIAALLGTPLYFSTALFVPIADALTATGVGIGAVVALTISGTGASIPEFVLLTKLARTRLLILLFTYVLAVAITGGLLTHAIVR